jgi:hypothetical protein
VLFCVDQTSPGLLPDKSGTVPSGLVRVKGELVWTGVFNSTFDDCFEHNLITVSPIDPFLLPLAS